MAKTAILVSAGMAVLGTLGFMVSKVDEREKLRVRYLRCQELKEEFRRLAFYRWPNHICDDYCENFSPHNQEYVISLRKIADETYKCQELWDFQEIRHNRIINDKNVDDFIDAFLAPHGAN